MRNTVLITLLAGALLLAGCNKKLTRVNFDKLQPGVTTLSEAQRILGSAEREEGGGGFNVGASGLSSSTGQRGDETWVWKSGDAEIRITVRDGKIVDKFQTGLE